MTHNAFESNWEHVSMISTTTSLRKAAERFESDWADSEEVTDEMLAIMHAESERRAQERREAEQKKAEASEKATRGKSKGRSSTHSPSVNRSLIQELEDGVPQ